MSSSGEEEDTGPSVDSTDPEERIEARRLRIQRRIEAQKRAQMGEDPNEIKEVKQELSKSRKQMEESRQRLTKQKEDGFELVTNIRVAGDAREAMRRVEEDENKRHRKEKLEAEAKAASERFDEITRKWDSALQRDIPQDLNEMLMQQKAACDAMVDEKNKLINDFQMELKQKDDQYVKDLKKQAEDIDLMIERMDEQVKQLSKAYRDELEQIERAFVAERTELFENHNKKWEQTMESRRDKEKDGMKTREKRVDDYEQQLQHLRVQDAEEYNMVKIKLETDVQILQQQLQQMKATYQLNQEKLEYNFQVLRKRDEENTITKSQQKRKITRLQDVLTNQKAKLAKQEKQYRDENAQLTEDYKRITEQFRELQKKSKHFMSTDYKKFHDIWVMNEEEAKQLVQKAVEEDEIIHQYQLGLAWQQPELEFMDNVGPILSEAAKRKAVPASQVVQEVMSATGGTAGRATETGTGTGFLSERSQAREESGMEKDGKEGSGPRTTILTKYSPRLIKQILELLCDESGFLIESKLKKLLSPLDRDEQSLMKLDAIFSALGVETENDIQILASYFLAQQQPQQPEAKSATASEAGRTSTGTGPEPEQSFLSSQKSLQEEGDEVDQEIEEVTGRDLEEDDGLEAKSPDSERSAAASHELIHPNEVLKALRAFVEDNKEAPKDKNRNAQFIITSLDDRDDSDDTAYWEQYPGVLPENTERLWDALLVGLEKYSEILQSRASLITETDALQQQNAELRMLLHQYVNSKVNQELEIPPTRMLQLELNPPQ